MRNVPFHVARHLSPQGYRRNSIGRRTGNRHDLVVSCCPFVHCISSTMSEDITTNTLARMKPSESNTTSSAADGERV
jgi:hypothetical protein